jgi:hypothetical protein
LWLASCASFQKPPAACPLLPAPTSALRSISVGGYARKDDVVNLSEKAARACALAAEDREAQMRFGASDGLMERALSVRFWRAGGRAFDGRTEADQSALANGRVRLGGWMSVADRR